MPIFWVLVSLKYLFYDKNGYLYNTNFVEKIISAQDMQSMSSRKQNKKRELTHKN
jgi:hypothetical protein